MNLRSFLDWLKSEGAAPEKAASTDWREKRKENRVDLPPSHRLIVRLLAAGTGPAATGVLKNASVRGGRLVLENPEAAELMLGQRLQSVLVVDGADVPLTLEVKRVVGRGEAGVRFIPPFPKELERLERFLEPRCLGRSLREIDATALQETSDKRLRWFQGVNETGLFSWFAANGRIVQQQLVFLDNVVEWTGMGPVRTGRVKADVAEAGPGWVRSELLEFQADVDPAVLAQARIVLESSLIEDDVRQTFLEKLAQG